MSFWTDALERKADDGRARQLYDEIVSNAPSKDAAEYVELVIKIRIRGGSTAVEDAVRIDSAEKLLAVGRYVRHTMSRFGTVSVLTTSGQFAVLHTIRTGEIVDVEAVTRTVALNSEDQRRAAGFHPPRPTTLANPDPVDLSDFHKPIPGQRTAPQGEQLPETD